MLETQSREARHIQEEMIQWTWVRSAKARASMARAKESKDSRGSKTRTRTGTRTRTQFNVRIAESEFATRRIVGARRNRLTEVVQRERNKTRTQRTLTILSRRNQQTVFQKLKSVDST